MENRTKVQLIRHATNRQWYVDVPMAVARELKLEKGEEIEWQVKDQAHLVLKRSRISGPAEDVKKKTDRF